MSVYELYDEEPENFSKFEIDIFINFQQNVSIFQVEIDYHTKFSDVFKFVKTSLEQFNKSINNDDDHHFVYINNRGDEEQLFHEDWNLLVKDLDILSFEKFPNSRSSISEKIFPFRTIKLEETHGSLDINRYKLEKMIGLKKDVMLSVIPSEEKSIFEESSRKLLVEASRDFQAKTLEEKLLIEHPIEINKSKTKTITNKFNIQIQVAIDNFENLSNRNKNTYKAHTSTMEVESCDTIPTVIEKIINKFNERGDYYLKNYDYLLKIAEREEYLVSLEPIPIIKFQYLNLCHQRNEKPHLVLVSRQYLDKLYPVKPRPTPSIKFANNTINENEFRESYLPENEFIYIHDLWKHFIRSSTVDSYDEMDSPGSINSSSENPLSFLLDNLEASDFLYEVKINKIEYSPSNVITKDQKVIIIAGLYHGIKSLCEPQYREWPQDSSCCSVLFTLALWDLPRMTRFCFALAVVKQSISLKDVANNSQKKFIGWGNVMIYDHKAILKFDEIRYRLWSSIKPNLNPTGAVYSNPDGQLISPLLVIQFVPKLCKFKKIVYPAKEKLILEGGKLLNNAHTIEPTTDKDKEDIRRFLQADFSDDAMQEQEILWNYRYYIRNFYQDSLPKILNSKPWNSFENISMMHHVICGWPIDKDIIIALELLGSNFPDCDIRMMAVDSLSRIDWQEISLYLLQICQCLKYESYLNSNFIHWLLKLMISNAKIAQSIFYYMKVEISTCDWCKVMFATILYNFLQYSPSRCESLLRQYYATSELCLQNKILLQYSTIEGDKKIQALNKFRTFLSSEESKKLFNDFTCPLDCNIKLKTLNPTKCKFMDSKMRPVRLTWNVSTEFSSEFMVIYKNGDDLRQDSLILQIMHIMDSIWQRKDLDLKLLPYDVLACSKTEGYIQVVQEAETLANIDKEMKDEKKSKIFLSWLQKSNSPNEMESVVKNFTRSLAAYCVATFILGIGDRHSDNIMIAKKGHFFHIDFGHVLGNFKKIMGGMVSREWTKFILVSDFFDIVKSENDFKELCCNGYLAIREHSNLIFSLFKAMVNAGIPEISSMDDLNYLKETLQIGKNDDEARLYFINVYEDTRKKEMFVTLNWLAHNKRRNNK